MWHLLLDIVFLEDNGIVFFKLFAQQQGFTFFIVQCLILVRSNLINPFLIRRVKRITLCRVSFTANNSHSGVFFLLLWRDLVVDPLFPTSVRFFLFPCNSGMSLYLWWNWCSPPVSRRFASSSTSQNLSFLSVSTMFFKTLLSCPNPLFYHTASQTGKCAEGTSLAFANNLYQFLKACCGPHSMWFFFFQTQAIV